MVGKGFIAVYSIVLRFQLTVKGRAKILLGVEFLTQTYVERYMHVYEFRLYIAERLCIAG